MANPSLSGMSTSAGLMVNYLYDLNLLKERAERFQEFGGKFEYSPSIADILQKGLQYTPDDDSNR